MHYIYIHRYTINYNKVREACLSAGLSLSLLPSGELYLASNLEILKSLFEQVSVMPVVTLS